jgi:hypothetical protein
MRSSASACPGASVRLAEGVRIAMVKKGALLLSVRTNSLKTPSACSRSAGTNRKLSTAVAVWKMLIALVEERTSPGAYRLREAEPCTVRRMSRRLKAAPGVGWKEYSCVVFALMKPARMHSVRPFARKPPPPGAAQPRTLVTFLDCWASEHAGRSTARHSAARPAGAAARRPRGIVTAASLSCACGGAVGCAALLPQMGRGGGGAAGAGRRISGCCDTQ